MDDPEYIDDNDYCNYIDSSLVLIDYYKHQQAYGIEKQLFEIEKWVDQPIDNIKQNKPFVIEAAPGIGKKTLLIKWLQYHDENCKTKFKDTIITSFGGGSNSNYFYAIYEILIKLREKFDIRQKVELLEEKLRKYFGYWLDVCNKKIHEEIVNDSKIILLFDGIDRYRELENNKEVNVAFWLPKFFPDRVKVICSCDHNSESLKYFKMQKCKILSIRNEAFDSENLIKYYSQKRFLIDNPLKEQLISILKQKTEEIHNQPSFIKTFICQFTPYATQNILNYDEVNQREINKIISGLDYQKLKTLKTVDELMEYSLHYYSDVLMDSEKFKKLLFTLYTTQKGLTLEEILMITKISKNEWKNYLLIFKSYMLKYKNLWQIKNDYFRQVIVMKYGRDQNYLNKIHEDIAQALEASTNSIRKLEEETYHLFMSKNFFKLKETVSSAENFLLLFNPFNKYYLCRFWQKLEEQGFDPAIEYNKSIESFNMHYHPDPEEVFRIIVQISRFLKEFSDFETQLTPMFRHPPIKGGKDLSDIGLLDEIKMLDLYAENDIRKSTQILNETESLNVDIPSNRDFIRKHFIDELNEIIMGNDSNKNNESQGDQQYPSNVNVTRQFSCSNHNSDEEDSSQMEGQISLLNNQQDKNDKKQRDKRVDEIRNLLLAKSKDLNSDRKPTFYYYKRWLWMIFPWSCISQYDQCNYSNLIKICQTSPTNYMSVILENQFTKKALIIALDLKLKKQLMYTKREELTAQLNSLEILKKETVLIDKKIKVIESDKLQMEGNNQDKSKKEGDQDNQVNQNKKNSIAKIDPKMREKSQIIDTNVSKIDNSKITDTKNFFLTSDNTMINQQESISLPLITSKYEPQLNSTDVLNKSRIYKASHRNFQPEKSMFRIKGKNNITALPALNRNINVHTNKEIRILESQNKFLKQQYNEIYYSNKMMSKTLQEIRIKGISQMGKSGETMKDLIEKLDHLEDKIIKIENQYVQSKKLKERIILIIFICKRNTAQHEEWIRNLTFLLQNYKKLIKWEKEKINQYKLDIKNFSKLNYTYLGVSGDKMKNNYQILNQIRNNLDNKQKIDQFFNNTDQIIENSAMNQLEIINDKSKSQIVTIESPTKNQTNQKTQEGIQERLDQNLENFQKIKKLFKIKTNQVKEVLESDNYIKFLEKQQKMRELKGYCQFYQQKSRDLETHILEQKKQIQLLKKMQKDSSIQEQMEENQEFFNQSKNQSKSIENNEKLDSENSEQTIFKEQIREQIFKKQSQFDNLKYHNSKLSEAILSTLMIYNTLNQRIKDPQTLTQDQRDEIQKISHIDLIKFSTKLISKKEFIKNNLQEHHFNLFLKQKYNFQEIYNYHLGNISSGQYFLQNMQIY